MLDLRVALVLAMSLTACRRQASPPAPPGPAPAAAPVAAAPAAPATPDAAGVAADYDPTALADKGQEPLQIYLAEPRSPTWAPAVEEIIGGQLRRDLTKMVPETRELSITCHTLSCLILVDLPKDKLEAATQVMSLVTLGPITVNLGLSAAGRAQLLFLTDRHMADPAFFTGWYRRIRRQTLNDIRSGKRPNSLPVPVSQLPTD